MPESTPSGEALLIIGGILVVNQTNGKLEYYNPGTVIGGLSKGNLASMLGDLADVQKKWAGATELTTDATSPDDK